MSAYQEYKTTFKDLDCLLHALCTVPMASGSVLVRDQIEVHDESVNLVGYLGDKRAQKAHVVVRSRHVGASSNDVGFERLSDGTYVARISNFDSYEYGTAWQQKLSVEYSQELVKRKAARMGYRVATAKQKDGSIRMMLTK